MKWQVPTELCEIKVFRKHLQSPLSEKLHEWLFIHIELDRCSKGKGDFYGEQVSIAFASEN
jgi:hypothetical protein